MKPEASHSGGASSAATVRAGTQVAAWTLVSRLTGLLRVGAIAAILGPTYFGNLFQSANLLPNVVFELLTGPLFASLLMPAIVGYIDAREVKAVERVVGGFLGLVLAVFCAAVLLGVILAPTIITALTAAVSDPNVVRMQQEVGSLLLALLLPQVLCYSVIGCCVAVQQANGQFGLAAAAPVVENLGIVAVLVTYQNFLHGSTDLHGVGSAEIIWLGAGTTAAVGLHACVQWLGARKAGVTILPRLGWRTRKFGE